MLRQAGLILARDARHSLFFDIHPLGFRYYEHLQQRRGAPLQQVEASIRLFFNSEGFQRKYTSAYQKWAEAEHLLWTTDSEKQLTTIGHLCREAVQEFATALVDKYGSASNVTTDKAKTVARLKAVIAAHFDLSTSSVKSFLDALVAYWGETNDLIQRQEHGGRKEGSALVWEDGRRVVFNTAVVMFEIDHALSLSSGT